MAYQYPKDKAALPYYVRTVGKFCFPNPVGFPGKITADPNSVRPLAIGTDVDIIGTTDGIEITSNVDLSTAGIVKGDFVVLEGTPIDGIYELSLSDFAVSGVSRAYAPGNGLTFSSGYLWFLPANDRLLQKIDGDSDANFKLNCTPGDFLIVMDSSLDITVQAREIKKVTQDSIFVEKGFIGTIDGQILLIAKKSTINGISVKAVGAGVLNEVALDANDVLTFSDSDGLKPVYGDTGSNTFKILIQK